MFAHLEGGALSGLALVGGEALRWWSGVTWLSQSRSARSARCINSSQHTGRTFITMLPQVYRPSMARVTHLVTSISHRLRPAGGGAARLEDVRLLLALWFQGVVLVLSEAEWDGFWFFGGRGWLESGCIDGLISLCWVHICLDRRDGCGPIHAREYEPS